MVYVPISIIKDITDLESFLLKMFPYSSLLVMLLISLKTFGCAELWHFVISTTSKQQGDKVITRHHNYTQEMPELLDYLQIDVGENKGSWLSQLNPTFSI